MSAVFRRVGESPIEIAESWDFASQIADLTFWLSQPENAEKVKGAILDIGFNSRLESVAVQGESIPLEFMRQLVGLNVELWLSLYPPFEGHQ
jgi:hypothetical protein